MLSQLDLADGYATSCTQKKPRSLAHLRVDPVLYTEIRTADLQKRKALLETVLQQVLSDENIQMPSVQQMIQIKNNRSIL